MRMIFNKILYVAALAIAMAFLLGNTSLAANTENGEQIALTEDNQDAPEMDIESRKQLLINVLESSQVEVNALKERLVNLKLEGEEWQKIRENLLNTLSEFNDYYQDAKDSINSTSSAITLEEVKDLAKDLKEWRESTYTPELDKIINMVLIFESENFLKITQSRFDKVSADIKKLDKQKMIRTDSLKNYLSQIDKHLKNVRILNDGVKNLFLKSMAPVEEEIIDENEINTEETGPKENMQDTIKKMVIDSLKELKTAYEIFFAMNDKIKGGN